MGHPDGRKNGRSLREREAGSSAALGMTERKARATTTAKAKANNNSKGKGNNNDESNGKSRFPSGMTNKESGGVGA
jgi:hypothetical protein